MFVILIFDYGSMFCKNKAWKIRCILSVWFVCSSNACYVYDLWYLSSVFVETMNIYVILGKATRTSRIIDSFHPTAVDVCHNLWPLMSVYMSTFTSDRWKKLSAKVKISNTQFTIEKKNKIWRNATNSPSNNLYRNN